MKLKYLMVILLVFLVGCKITKDVWPPPDPVEKLMGEGEKFYINGSNFEVEVGEQIHILAGIQNFGNKLEKYSIEIESVDDKSWVETPSNVIVKPKEKQGFPILVKIPSATTSIYKIKLIDESGNLYDSKEISIKTK